MNNQEMALVLIALFIFGFAVLANLSMEAYFAASVALLIAMASMMKGSSRRRRQKH